VVEKDNFSFFALIMKNKKYVGQTRIYLGVTPSSLLPEDCLTYSGESYPNEMSAARTANDDEYQICNTRTCVPKVIAPRCSLPSIIPHLQKKVALFGTFFLLPWAVVDDYGKFNIYEFCLLLELPLKLVLSFNRIN
jgi:hypothetical protein